MLAHSGEAACKCEWWRRGFKQHGISFKQWFTEYRWCARARARARARTRARAVSEDKWYLILSYEHRRSCVAAFGKQKG